MALVSPSILAADFGNLQRDVQNIADNGGDWIHVDVMDGHFVPNLSMGLPVVRALRKITELPLDVHLMITEPIRYAEAFVQAGADILTIHVEADTLERNQDCLDRIRQLGCRPAISLKPGTPASAAEPYLDRVDMILVMTVEPGFGGQKFMADMLDKLSALEQMIRERGLSCRLQVDGGVDVTTAPRCKESGADVLVTGSAYFRAEDRAAYVRFLQG